MAMLIAPALSVTVPAIETASKRFDLVLNPVIGDFKATDWIFDEKTRLWSARVSGVKIDAQCEFVKGQTVIALVQLAPNAIPFEVEITFIDDDTPDSSRPAGHQDFGRWQLNSLNIPKGAIVIPSVKHNCSNREGNPVVSEILPPFIVGR